MPVAGGLWQCRASPQRGLRATNVAAVTLQSDFGMCRARVGTASRVGERCVDCLGSGSQVLLIVRVLLLYKYRTSTSRYEDRRAPDAAHDY